jgi:hypothetical protein
MRRRREANPRRVDTEKKNSIILSLRVLKLVTFSCYRAANISLSQNWMSILTSSTMMETMIRFTLSNCENYRAPYWRPLFVCVGKQECVALQEKARGVNLLQRGGYTVANQRSRVDLQYTKERPSNYCWVLRFARGLPLSFGCEGTFKIYDYPKVNTPVLRNATPCSRIFMYQYTRRHAQK